MKVVLDIHEICEGGPIDNQINRTAKIQTLHILYAQNWDLLMDGLNWAIIFFL